MNLKTNLKKIIKERDLTVAQLGRIAGVAKTTISEWIAGSTPRDLKKLKAVCEALDVSIDELCFGDGKPVSKKTLKDFEPEIFAGNFDVILRKSSTGRSES